MAGLLTIWWVWVCAALLLGLIELLVPASIFLGFAIGALAMALLVAIFTITNTAALLALFGALSLLGWIVLKLAFRRQSSGRRIVTHDINDN